MIGLKRSMYVVDYLELEELINEEYNTKYELMPTFRFSNI